MIRLTAIWMGVVAIFILAIVLREERLAAQGKVPLGRLRRLWMKSDRRRAPRYRVDWPIRYLRLGEPPPSLPAKTRDVSSTGVGLVVTERLTAGSQIELSLTFPGETSPLKVIGQVAWSREVSSSVDSQVSYLQDTRLFFVGLRFQGLDPQIQQRLIETLGGKRP